MAKIKVAVIGYGNVGRYALQAVQTAPDMVPAGIVRRNAQSGTIDGVPVTDDIAKLGDVHAALLCTPTRLVAQTAEKILAMGICTVDSFDIHEDIVNLRNQLDKTAKAHNTAAVIAAGWDPGSDSVVRALMEAMTPTGITTTDFGPGMSMGHSVAAKAVGGVAEALSMTIPTGAGIHRRMVYVVPEAGADFAKVAADIKADAYFCNDDTRVIQVPSVQALQDVGHGVKMSRQGASGQTHNQMLEFSMRINNPALTSQVMTACARAAVKQPPGAYTMIELPVIDLLRGERDDLIRRLV